MTKKCGACHGARMRVANENYQYRESGLANVVLQGVEVRRCPECGAVEVPLPRVAELHRVIAMAVIHKPARLSGTEVRFLRKHLGWSGEDFASHMGVDPSTVSKWENDKEAIGASSDRLLRMLVARRSPVEEYPDDALKNIKDRHDPPLRVRLTRRDQRWQAEANA
jgi:putative zinc finger/helix-turn-helix YgiT family protein